MCQFSHLARLRARPNNPENEMKKVSQKAKTRSEQRTRKGPDHTFKNHHFWEPKALRNRPQGSPKQPRKRVEAAGWQTQRKFATKNIPGTPPKASKSLRRAMRLSQEAPGRLRETGFALPGPLGTDKYQRKSFNNNSTRDLTRRWAAGPANFLHIYLYIIRGPGYKEKSKEQPPPKPKAKQ